MKTLRSPRLLYLAPFLVLAHVLEEAPGLVAWINHHVERDLTLGEFWAINAFGLIVTVVVAAASVRWPNYFASLVLIAWLSFVMLANGVIHLAASVLFGEYVPGTVTAGVLYLPYFILATVTLCRNFDVRPRAAILAATIGSVPMLAHGISILTVGRPILW